MRLAAKVKLGFYPIPPEALAAMERAMSSGDPSALENMQEQLQTVLASQGGIEQLQRSLTDALQQQGAGDLLALIRSGQATTRGALGRITGLSRTAVSARLAPLERAGLVVDGEQESATGGRPASTLVFNADAGLVLAIALGRSRSQVAVCDLDGTELVVLDAPSHVHLAYRPGVPLVAQVLGEPR